MLRIVFFFFAVLAIFQIPYDQPGADTRWRRLLASQCLFKWIGQAQCRFYRIHGRGLLHDSAAFRPAIERGLFLFGVSLQAHHQIVEVDFVPVEIRTIDTGKFYFVADLDPAAAAHPRAIDHDWVEADDRLDRMRARDFNAGLHHDGRADRHDLVDIFVPRDGKLDAVADEALHPGRPVVGAQDQLVATLSELVRPENQALGAETEHPDHIGAVLFESTRLRVDRRDAQAATDADDLFVSGERARDPHGPNDPVKRSPRLADLLHLLVRLADRLDNQGHGALFTVEVRNGEWNPLTGLMRPHNDELTTLCGFRHQRVMDDQGIGHVGKVFPGQNSETCRGACVVHRFGSRT